MATLPINGQAPHSYLQLVLMLLTCSLCPETRSPESPEDSARHINLKNVRHETTIDDLLES